MPKNSLNVSLKGADDIFYHRGIPAGAAVGTGAADSHRGVFSFKNHPFKVLDDESMQRTVESVEQYGCFLR